MVAEFAEFLFGVAQPLEETFLVDEFDGAGADTRMEQGPVRGGFASTNTANVCKKEEEEDVKKEAIDRLGIQASSIIVERQRTDEISRQRCVKRETDRDYGC